MAEPEDKPTADNDLVYINDDGTLDRITGHAEILAGKHPVADAIGRQIARELGLSEEENALLDDDGG